MANKREYLARLRLALQCLHKCAAVYRETVPVHEMLRGETIWKGEVEVYELIGHPKARRAYAWSHREGPRNESERFISVLEIPPVESAKAAVHDSIMRGEEPRRGTV